MAVSLDQEQNPEIPAPDGSPGQDTLLFSIRDKLTGFETGMNGYRTKPFEAEELLKTISLLLAKT